MPTSARQGVTREPDPTAAVEDLARQLGAEPLDAVFFFCSPDYDLEAVGRALKACFPCPVLGCSSSGQIGPGGFQRGGMTALGLAGGYLRIVPHLIHPLADFQEQALRIASAFRETRLPGASVFGFLLVDGLSMMEERLVSALYQALDNVPIIGGSAGDDLRFKKTLVYHDGRFLADAAVFGACTAGGPIAPFMVHHFRPGATRLVITDSDPDQRIIREFNGEPAAQVYAEAIGVEVAHLSPELFSSHPLLMRFGDEHFVRSMATCHPDGSLTMYCAIETGLVVTIGEAVEPMAALRSAFQEALGKVPDAVAILACDCILRRLEFEHLGTDQAVGDLMAQHHVLGFSTYGEQFNGMHVNQTMTGIVLGRAEGS
jgi:hypothetical protein